MIEKEINLRDSNKINENTIIRYPFYGKSKYLIDKLYIIGYDNATINKYLNENKNKKKKKETNDNIDTSVRMMRQSSKINQSKEIASPFDNINQYSISERPVLINEIVNNYNKDSLDIDIIIDMIFPNDPIYYAVKETKKELSPAKNGRNNSNYINIKTEVGNIGNNNNNIINGTIKEIINKKKYFMVFSSNPQIDKKNKVSINGFVYINYCKYKDYKKINGKGYKYYFPVALCFLSEFPFYQSYYKLAQQIFHLFKSQKIEVPIEIMLYNLINSTLSPINGDVDLCIEPVSFYNNIINNNSNSINNSDKINKSEKKEKERKKEISPFKITENSNDIKKEENYANSSKILIHVEKKNVKFKDSLKKSKVLKEEDIERIKRTKSFGNNKFSKKYSFEQIKFPLLQTYPLLQYNLPKILFDSMPITKIIFIFINTFLEKDILIFSENIEILSLLINTFQNLNYPLNDNTYYNINASTSFNNYVKGNCKYIPKAFNCLIGINSSFKINYISDDKYKLEEYILYDLDNKDIHIKTKNDNDLYEYIRKILKLKDDKEYKGSALFYEIRKLSEILHDIRDKYKTNNQNEDILHYNKKLNLEIQEVFYKFIVNILSYFYRLMNIEDVNNEIKISLNKDYENELNKKYKNTLEEDYFFNEFKKTFKYDFFFKNYLNNHDCLEFYNIPYLFLDEYISLISSANDLNANNNYTLSFFNIFEKLYNKKQSQKVNIDFNTFLSEYFKKYKNDFDRDIKDFNKDGRNIIKYLELDKSLYYQWYELDNNLLLKYILFIKSLDNDEYERMFNINAILDDNNPKRIRIEDIEDEIEKEIISNNFYDNNLLIDDDDICCMNIITLLSISLKYINTDLFNTVCIGSFLKEFFLFRKYYLMLLDMIYRIINYELNISNIQKVEHLLSIYYPCINLFREKHIIPNEKITNIIININRIEHEYREKKEKNEKNEIICEQKINEGYNKIDDKNYIIFIIHNISQYEIIKEKKILKYVNSDDENDKNNWKNRLGFIITSTQKDGKQILVIPKIKYIGKYKKKENEIDNIYFESEIFSQRKIKEILNEEYKKYINKDLDIKSINIKNIIDCLLNITIYIRNSEKLKDILDFSDIIKNILLYYINYSIQ